MRGETLDPEEKLLHSLPCFKRWLRASPVVYLSFLSLLFFADIYANNTQWWINSSTLPPCSAYQVIPDFVGHQAGALSTGVKKLQWESSEKGTKMNFPCIRKTLLWKIMYVNIHLLVSLVAKFVFDNVYTDPKIVFTNNYRTPEIYED